MTKKQLAIRKKAIEKAVKKAIKTGCVHIDLHNSSPVFDRIIMEEGLSFSLHIYEGRMKFNLSCWFNGRITFIAMNDCDVIGVKEIVDFVINHMTAEKVHGELFAKEVIES